MAVVESCLDSPRTSLSYDFGPPDTIASDEKQTIQLSNISSDFCFQSNNVNQESSSAVADELFLDGKILPVQIQERINNLSSKQILQPIVVQPFPPLQAYVHSYNSRNHSSEVNKIGSNNINQESDPSSDNNLVLSVKIKKKISCTKQMQQQQQQPKPFPPLHELLYGATTSVSDGAPNHTRSFTVKNDAGNGEEHNKKELKSRWCSMNCCGSFKCTSRNGGFCPFPLVFRSDSIGSSQSPLPRDCQNQKQNPKELKQLRTISPTRQKSPSLKQLIVGDHKLHISSHVSHRKPSLKQLIVNDYMEE